MGWQQVMTFPAAAPPAPEALEAAERTRRRLGFALLEFGREIGLVAMLTLLAVIAGAAGTLWLAMFCLCFGWPLWAVASWTAAERIAVFILWRYILLGVITAGRVSAAKLIPGAGWLIPPWHACDLPPAPASPGRTARLVWTLRAAHGELRLERAASNLFTFSAGGVAVVAGLWIGWLCFAFGWPAWVFPAWPLSTRILGVVLWSLVWLSFNTWMRVRREKKHSR